MAEVFPNRNLGAAEQWGREVESKVIGAENDLSDISQSLGNTQRTSTSHQEVIARQLEHLQTVISLLQETQDRVTETVSTGFWSDTVAGGAWGTLVTVDAPEWASTGIVVVGMDSFSNQSSPWWGEIQVIASENPPVLADLDKSRDPASAQVDDGFALVNSNPRIVSLNREDESSASIYIRPRGVRRGGGAASRTYSFNAAYAIIWS